MLNNDHVLIDSVERLTKTVAVVLIVKMAGSYRHCQLPFRLFRVVFKLKKSAQIHETLNTTVKC